MVPYTFEEPRMRAIAQRIHDLSRDLKLIEQFRAPSIVDIGSAPLLENWTVGHRMEVALMGEVTNHPNVGPGPVITSGLYYLDPIAGYARTLSRWYRLGSPLRHGGPVDFDGRST